MTSELFLAQRVLKWLAEDKGPTISLAMNILLYDFYIYDCSFRADTQDSLRHSCNHLISLLAKERFAFRKQANNSADLLNDISVMNRGLALDRKVSSDDVIKLLSLVWKPTRD